MLEKEIWDLVFRAINGLEDLDSGPWSQQPRWLGKEEALLKWGELEDVKTKETVIKELIIRVARENTRKNLGELGTPITPDWQEPVWEEVVKKGKLALDILC